METHRQATPARARASRQTRCSSGSRTCRRCASWPPGRERRDRPLRPPARARSSPRDRSVTTQPSAHSNERPRRAETHVASVQQRGALRADQVWNALELAAAEQLEDVSHRCLGESCDPGGIWTAQWSASGASRRRGDHARVVRRWARALARTRSTCPERASSSIRLLCIIFQMSSAPSALA